MKIEELELKIFKDLDTLKQFIRDNFNVDEDEEDGVVEIEHDSDFELDDELAFCDEEYDYSVYYMKDTSGRVIVVETSRQRY